MIIIYNLFWVIWVIFWFGFGFDFFFQEALQSSLYLCSIMPQCVCWIWFVHLCVRVCFCEFIDPLFIYRILSLVLWNHLALFLWYFTLHVFFLVLSFQSLSIYRQLDQIDCVLHILFFNIFKFYWLFVSLQGDLINWWVLIMNRHDQICALKM